MTDSKPFDVNTLKAALSARSSTPIEWAAQDDPIVCIDEHYKTLEEFSDISSAVRLMLDDWPSYADAPWTPISIAKEHPEMMAAVLEQDKNKLGNGTEVAGG